MRRSPLVLVAAALVLMPPALTSAGPTPAQKCEAAIEKAAGLFAQCRLKAESAFTLNLKTLKRDEKLAGCLSAFGATFSKTLSKFGSSCPVTEPVQIFQDTLTKCTEAVTTAAPGGVFPACGDAVVNAVGEHCDTGDLGGATCASLGLGSGTLACSSGCKFETSACVSGGGGPAQAFPATGQTTCWDPADTTNPIDTISCVGTGQDGEIRAGAALSYQDNGDGTLTDLNTGLMWEKLDRANGIHHVDDVYTWANAFVVKIAALNTAPCFAAHCDWRLPNVKELTSIVDYEPPFLKAPPAFDTGCVDGCTIATCSCTENNFYWTATTLRDAGHVAFSVYFEDGSATPEYAKTEALHVRAVRSDP